MPTPKIALLAFVWPIAPSTVLLLPATFAATVMGEHELRVWSLVGALIGSAAAVPFFPPATCQSARYAARVVGVKWLVSALMGWCLTPMAIRYSGAGEPDADVVVGAACLVSFGGVPLVRRVISAFERSWLRRLGVDDPKD